MRSNREHDNPSGRSSTLTEYFDQLAKCFSDVANIDIRLQAKSDSKDSPEGRIKKLAEICAKLPDNLRPYSYKLNPLLMQLRHKKINSQEITKDDWLSVSKKLKEVKQEFRTAKQSEPTEKILKQMESLDKMLVSRTSSQPNLNSKRRNLFTDFFTKVSNRNNQAVTIKKEEPKVGGWTIRRK